MLAVIGAGFGRTGTTTLVMALESLGFGPCYHMFEVIRRPDRVRQWLAVTEGRADWDRVYAGYASAVDWPTAAYWRELAEYYPRAKIILTVRDPYRWYDSAAATIFSFRLRIDRGLTRPYAALVKWTNPDYADYYRMTGRIVWQRALRGAAYDRDRAAARFTEHVAEVRAAIPAERLLVYDVAQGWEPLCAFLGVPVPDLPFPRANDTAAFRAFWRRRLARLSVRPALVVAAAGVAAAATLRGVRRRRR